MASKKDNEGELYLLTYPITMGMRIVFWKSIDVVSLDNMCEYYV
jgi:hypothetical protein